MILVIVDHCLAPRRKSKETAMPRLIHMKAEKATVPRELFLSDSSSLRFVESSPRPLNVSEGVDGDADVGAGSTRGEGKADPELLVLDPFFRLGV